MASDNPGAVHSQPLPIAKLLLWYGPLPIGIRYASQCPLRLL